MIKYAKFSEDKKYRYVLARLWDETKPNVICIGLNPSTANEETDDPTIGRLTNVLMNLNFGGFYMMNLYALITPKPELLFNVSDAIGENDKWLINKLEVVDKVIFCWGGFKGIEHRVKKVKEIIPKNIPVQCFGKNKDGSPWHPSPLNTQMTKAYHNNKSATLLSF